MLRCNSSVIMASTDLQCCRAAVEGHPLARTKKSLHSIRAIVSCWDSVMYDALSYFLWSQVMARAIGEQSHRAAAGTVPSWSRHRPAHLVYNGKARYFLPPIREVARSGPGTQSPRVEVRPRLTRCLAAPNQSGGLHHSRAGCDLRGPRKPPEASVRLSLPRSCSAVQCRAVPCSAAQQCSSGLGGLLFPALPIGRAQP